MARIAIDLSPLRASRELRLLMAGQGVGMIGGMVLYVAIPIQLYAETHSTLAVGLIGLVELGPLLVASILGGAIADVVERVRMAVRVELGVAATAALLALNSVTGPNVAALYVLAGASTGISCLGLPASRALLPNLVPQERLAAANALNGTVINFGAVAGPGIGGVLVAVLGATGAYLAGGVVVLAGAATLRLLPPVPTKPRRGAGRPGVGTDDHRRLPLRDRHARRAGRVPGRHHGDDLRLPACPVPGVRG
jgi:MFS family permease